ncbi:TetR/AcrR family transcriptional regulator [Streptomyces bottropensis]|jgi:AcrR family transcriptional regulator|uniref:TetR/AcrR family transcriptional regulator n=1 Tax=Streptomyces bottropensis TaxID=42235 RepID=A0ABU8B0Z8_9ACTN
MTGASPAAPTPKGHQRRTALLDAAERILVSSGSAELTMRAVATEAGVRLGHLQYYFPARSDLLAALLDRVLVASLGRVSGLTDTDDGGIDVTSVLDSVLSDHDDVRLVRLFTEVWSMAAHDESAAAAVRSFYAQYMDRVAEFIRNQSPGLPDGAVQSRAEVFVMLMEGSALFRSGVIGSRSPKTDSRLRGVLLGLLGGRAGRAEGCDES